MITAKGLKKSFGTLEVLKGIDLKINKGELVSLVGTSGAGKTTLLQLLGTLDQPDSGSLEINGFDINELTQKEIANFRNQYIGFVFQFHHLLPEFSALENVCIPAFIAKYPQHEAEEQAKELLCTLGLQDRMSHKPSELSGGEQQRVAVARALINRPAVIFADEPSGNLDSENSKELHDLFFSLREKFDQTFLIATHNLELAKLADKILVIKDGIISQQ